MRFQSNALQLAILESQEKIERFQQIIGYIVNSMLFYAGNWFTFPKTMQSFSSSPLYIHISLSRFVCVWVSVFLFASLKSSCFALLAVKNEIGIGVSLLGMNACDRWTICMSLIRIEIVVHLVWNRKGTTQTHTRSYAEWEQEKGRERRSIRRVHHQENLDHTKSVSKYTKGAGCIERQQQWPDEKGERASEWEREIMKEWTNKLPSPVCMHSHFECQIFYFNSNFASALFLFAQHKTDVSAAQALRVRFLFPPLRCAPSPHICTIWWFAVRCIKSTSHPIFSMIFRYIGVTY